MRHLTMMAGLITASTLMTAAVHAADVNNISMYPAPVEGQTRYVISLPPQKDESLLKVEIVAGRTESVDCNQHAYRGELDEQVVQGWGYNYYTLDDIKPGPATRMACAKPASPRFVPVVGSDFIVRYNSKLPLVVYSSGNFSVSYRVWRGDAKTTAATPK